MPTTTPLRTRSALAVTLLVLGALASTPALAERSPIRTIRRPTVINRPGHYEVAFNFTSAGAGAAIEIRASDVVLDLGGHTLTGPGEKNGVGVLVDGATNVRIGNGSLRQFGIGVQVVGATNVCVEDLRIDGEDLGGVPPAVEIGILVLDSRAVIVEHNTITDTFLGIFVRGEGSRGNRIANNTLVAGDHGELGICYNPAPGSETGGPSGDRVYANHVAGFNRGIALSADSHDNFVLGNTLATQGDALQEATAGSNVIEGNESAELE